MIEERERDYNPPGQTEAVISYTQFAANMQSYLRMRRNNRWVVKRGVAAIKHTRRVQWVRERCVETDSLVSQMEGK